MKHNWQYKKLGEICTIVGRIGFRGYTREDLVEKGKGAISLSPSNIVDGKLDFSNKVSYISWDKYYESPEIMLAVGDVVFTKTASVGKCAFVKRLPIETTINPQLVVLKKIKCNPSFLTYTLQDNRFQEAVLSKKGGTSIPTISQAFLSSLSIPVPSLEEQERIVAELDRINGVMEDCRQLLRTLDALAQSLFYDSFGDIYSNPKGWITCNLGDVSEKISNGANTKIGLDTYKPEGIMFFRCQNVLRNKFDLSDIVYVDEETNSKMKGSILKHNDLLVTKIGRLYTENSSLGRVALYEGEDDQANLSGNLSFIRLKPNVSPKFILYILISDYFREYVRNTTVGGIDKRALNNSQLKSLPIYLPPLELQQQFARRIEAIETQKKAVEKTIATLQTLLDSRMDYWFN